MLGALASSAGDDFHELWALHHVLGLLDPASGVVEIKVEGVPADEIHADLGEHAQAVDVTKRLRHARGKDSFLYEQLKYSPSAPDNPWTWSRLTARTAKTKQHSSVLGKMARAFARVGGCATFSIITNQPAHGALAEDVKRLARILSKKSPLKRTEGDEALIADLEAATGFSGRQLANFLRVWDLSGFGSVSRLHLETDIVRRVGEITDADARNDAIMLQQKIAELVLPENRRFDPVTRKTVLVWLGAGSSEVLFPAPSRISPPTKYLRRKQTDDLVARIFRAKKPLRLISDGGCGKTSLVSSLAQELPLGSETIIYDCYGGGLFLASDDRRHAPEQAFVQVANEIAGRLAVPFALRRSSSGAIAAAFKRRLEAAGQILAARASEALLVVCFDAVDNSRIAAEHWKEKCFLDELLALSQLPANVRIVLTCRRARADKVGLPTAFEDFHLTAFDEGETEHFVALHQPSWPVRIAATMHDLTGGTARRLAYALDQLGPDQADEAISRLMPRAHGIDPLFERLVEEAGVRIGGPEKVWLVLCGLANFPRPVPAWVLAEVAGLLPADVADIATDVGGIVCRADGWSFHDEDFEHFVSSQTADVARKILETAAELLFEKRHSDDYAARAVGEILMRAEKWSQLYDLVRRADEAPAHLGKVEARLVQARRLALALRCCKEAKDVRTACGLLIAAAEGIKSERLVNDLLTKNLRLSSRFSPEQVMRLVLRESRYASKRASLRVQLAAASASTQPGSARDHLRWWWTELQSSGLGEEKRRLDLAEDDVAAEYEALAILRDPSVAFDAVRRWRGLDRVFERLASNAAGRQGEAILVALEARDWPPKGRVPLMLAALLSGVPANHALLREGLVQLSRASAARWKIDPPERNGRLISNSDATLLVCELMHGEGDLSEAILRVLELAYPPSQARERWDLNRIGSSADLLGRVIALRELLTGHAESVEQHFPPKKEIPRATRPRRRRGDYEWLRPREKGEEDLWNEALIQAQARVTRFLLAARAARRHSEQQTQIETIRNALKRPYNESRYASEGFAIFRFVRAWLVQLASSDAPLDDAISAGIAILKDWGIGSLANRTDLAASLAHVPTAHPQALNLLLDVAAEAETMSGPASERAELLMGCARAALPLDAELARDMYERAVSVTEKVDIEVLAQVELCAQIAEAGVGGDREDLSATAEDLADVVAATDATLGTRDNFPWGDAIQAIAAVDLPTGLATLSQWRDIGLVPLSISIPSLLGGEAAKRLTGHQRFALAVLESNESLDLGALYGGAPPAAALDYVARSALVSSSATEVQDARWTLEAYKPTSETPAGFRLREAAEAISTWQSSSDESSFEAEVSLRTLDTSEKIRAAIDELASTEHPYSHSLERLARRVANPALRTGFLRYARERAGSEGWFGLSLAEFLTTWSDYPPVAKWVREELPAYIAAALRHLFEWRYDETDIVEGLLVGTQLPPAAQAEIVFEGILQFERPPSAELIYALTGVIARRADPEARTELLRDLLARTRRRLDQPPKLSMKETATPESLSECVAKTLYAAMGDLDRRVRWQAAHAVLQLFRLDDRDTCGEFGRILLAEEEAAFVPRALPFYLHAAREVLLMAVERASLDNPSLTGSAMAEPVLQLINSTTHATVRELGRSLLLRLVALGAISQKRYDCRKIADINRSPFRRRERQVRRFGKDHDARERKRRFSFDSTDTIPYWYSEPADLFDLPMSDFLDRVERWVHGKWGFVETDSHWLEEPRLERLREESGQTSHRHGDRPVIERLSRYVEWHGMMCAVGEMLPTTPLVKADRYDRTFEQWLAQHIPTITPHWLADLRTAPPLERRFWGYDEQRLPWQRPEGEDEDPWASCIPPDVFDEEIVARTGEVVVAADFDLKNEDRTESVGIQSAFVSPTTAYSLGHALLTARDNMDFILPPAGDHRGCDEPGFCLQGWLTDNDGEALADRFDVKRGAVKGVPFRPAKKLAQKEGLLFNADLNGWTRGGETDPCLSFSYWGEREPVAPGGGWRGTASRAFLCELMARQQMSMIFCVEIARRSLGDSGGRSKKWQLYVLDEGGRLVKVEQRRRSLGRYLVHKKGMDYSVDTLARWQLHRIEELMVDMGSFRGRALDKRQDEIQKLYSSFERGRRSQRW
jgi:hypothetical protein